MNWNELFRYEDGNLYHKNSMGNQVKEGDLVGCVDKSTGYVRASVKNKRYYVHRIIWEMYNGTMPEGMQIDHISGIRSDNRIENLRVVTHTINMRNQKKYATNTSGVTGVCWSKKSSKWRAHIKVNNKKIHLGYFEDWFEAVCARKSTENKYGFHENHGRIL
jgi:hypothetical protein